MNKEGEYHNLEGLILMSDGDTEFQALLVTTFCEEAPGMVDAMQNAHVEGDLKTMGRYAHSLKPNVELFGIRNILDEILLVEDAGKTGETPPGLKEAVDKIRNVIYQVVKELQ